MAKKLNSKKPKTLKELDAEFDRDFDKYVAYAIRAVERKKTKDWLNSLVKERTKKDGES